MLPMMQQELDFWKEFVQTDRFLCDWAVMGKTSELVPFVADFIIDQKPKRILDVGSGVASILNGLLPDVPLIAVDVLGAEYQEIFDYDQYRIYPPIAIAAEDISFENEFDIVHMSNALDHTQEPVIAYKKLYEAVKPGGFLIIQGFENEGQFEKYAGMHQWDLYVDEKSLYMKTKIGKLLIAMSSFMPAKRIPVDTDRDWYIWITQK